MKTSHILILVAVVAIIVYFYNRKKKAPDSQPAAGLDKDSFDALDGFHAGWDKLRGKNKRSGKRARGKRPRSSGFDGPEE